MIVFSVKDPNKAYNDYIVMYKRIKGSLKGRLRKETFRMRLMNNHSVKLPNAEFVPQTPEKTQ
jgi:hypothetical protein